MTRLLKALSLVALIAFAPACKKDPAAVPAGNPAPFPGASAPRTSTPTVARDVAPPPAVAIPADQPIVAMSDPLSATNIEAINQDSPLQPVYFAYDSDTLDERARGAMSHNADVLRKYANWVVTIEGHCDERGTPEYNLALGERRAQAVRNYMVSLGIGADRLKTVSYGSEFPFSPGHDESAWSQNRRAHFMLTARQ